MLVSMSLFSVIVFVFRVTEAELDKYAAEQSPKHIAERL
jgi:hypothetical protein